MMGCKLGSSAAMDVVVWLRSLGLWKYEAVFRENDIDETVLLTLTAPEGLGVQSSRLTITMQYCLLSGPALSLKAPCLLWGLSFLGRGQNDGHLAPGHVAITVEVSETQIAQFQARPSHLGNSSRKLLVGH
jgi:hypothetical protein